VVCWLFEDLDCTVVEKKVTTAQKRVYVSFLHSSALASPKPQRLRRCDVTHRREGAIVGVMVWMHRNDAPQ
jgi:3-methyladenine DNA glycosylase/8-oxoguanine DNA glycosylase